MNISGKILIASEWLQGEGNNFNASNPSNGQQSSETFSNASTAQAQAATLAASQAFDIYSQYSDQKKATFLRTIGIELEKVRSAIVQRATWETALPESRINGELGRTIGQLNMFAQLLEDGDWKRPVIDLAQPDRQPLPKPDIRLTQVPLGPVVVFSASNFPLAFSVAGGDTASALAAGCPVIVKNHNAHPGTSEIVASAIVAAIKQCGIPSGVFSMLHGDGRIIGAGLVTDPKVKAVGFTGSITGGRALYNLAVGRPEPIPFYGELGSTNPVFLLPKSLDANAEEIASSFIGALMMGVGQFCTSPGILIAIKGQSLNRLLASLAEKTPALNAASMLTAGICKSYQQSCLTREAMPSLTKIASGESADSKASQAQVNLFSVDAVDYLKQTELEEEVFGPSTLVVCCEDSDQLLAVAKSLGGHLTAALFSEEADQDLASQLLPVLQQRVGRILFDGYGTGVELSSAMSHGGPYPSSTASQTTSVGTRSIERFIRPVCYQNTPDALLPIELKNANPDSVMRLVNNKWSTDAIS
ncbi:2,5-dioxovalerate dehydrogenase [Marinomonas ushuaiensis DSM 15871]|uniref:2,5-dioxovalerate dehydrogenase n=1 Tax=Marinomonas ushuaiensis DSM 15871 TaxID=1122207 RepID=X7EB87_9GAMM|nr:aldehyde dehydrogenase (NADP(+)) [Marinomonas ushuaiensis]ETX12363.1 2,5-dioxovalerate dehydrogenase [Marinomonas ushuaiensis DSM 15871]